MCSLVSPTSKFWWYGIPYFHLFYEVKYFQVGKNKRMAVKIDFAQSSTEIFQVWRHFGDRETYAYETEELHERAFNLKSIECKIENLEKKPHHEEHRHNLDQQNASGGKIDSRTQFRFTFNIKYLFPPPLGDKTILWITSLDIYSSNSQ